jgi:hypothetical protein
MASARLPTECQRTMPAPVPAAADEKAHNAKVDGSTLAAVNVIASRIGDIHSGFARVFSQRDSLLAPTRICGTVGSVSS